MWGDINIYIYIYGGIGSEACKDQGLGRTSMCLQRLLTFECDRPPCPSLCPSAASANSRSARGRGRCAARGAGGAGGGLAMTAPARGGGCSGGEGDHGGPGGLSMEQRFVGTWSRLLGLLGITRARGRAAGAALFLGWGGGGLLQPHAGFRPTRGGSCPPNRALPEPRLPPAPSAARPPLLGAGPQARGRRSQPAPGSISPQPGAEFLLADLNPNFSI